MNNELYHYGIPGMKWGVRRYQNADGSYTAAGKYRYNYKKSDSYKTQDRGQKTYQTNRYTKNKDRYGRRAANAIEYNVREKGSSYRKEQFKTAVKQTVLSPRTMVYAIELSPILLAAGESFINQQKVYMQVHNAAMRDYANYAGLNDIGKVGGFNLGFDAINKDKKYMKAMGY